MKHVFGVASRVTESTAAFLLTAACLLAHGCVSSEKGPQGEVVRTNQIEKLKRITSLEREVAVFAAGHPDVSGAEVHIRSQAAVVILSPAGTGKILQRTVDEINALIMQQTGLRKDQIVMKVRNRTGGKK